MDRRTFLTSLAFPPEKLKSSNRAFHLCAGTDVLERNPELLEIARRAGVETIWLAGFFYGHWYYTPEKVKVWAARIHKAGMKAELIHLPLGHPGDSLGAQEGAPPLIPPPHWRQAVRPDGSRHWGTSLHAPAVEENAAASRRWAGSGFKCLFLDDDFRLATGPGTIGGCHCDDHWRGLRMKAGFTDADRKKLKEDIRSRSLSPLVRAWVEFHCDELTNCYRRMAEANREIDLGVMVMYLGSEKAGIRLKDYTGSPFRVGELMFDDRHFDPVKGKTDELFSSLFHRRFTSPEKAFSETTAFPADKLSAPNMAAKLAISTLSDVRNTMFMSGMTPFPLTHWETLRPAMRHQAALHRKVAGLRPQGPFKHYWGEASRYVGADKPYSLFLATGVPFEVCGQPPRDGWTFLSDEDARFAPRTAGTQWIGRKDAPETLEDLFALRRRILPQLKQTPYIEEEFPAVCSWLRDARLVLIWNLSAESRGLTLRYGKRSRRVQAAALGLELVELGDPG
jgi:hypothetical protein